MPVDLNLVKIPAFWKNFTRSLLKKLDEAGAILAIE
jgi:hypothetical protein